MPPPELKFWSKRSLIREVERLRALIGEHSRRGHDDAPEQSGGVAVDVAGDPHARGSVLLDVRGAVLLDTVDVALFDSDPGNQGPAHLMLSLAGRVNYETRHSSVAFIMGTDGAAAIVSELFGLAQRAGGDFLAELQARLDALP